jgi:hypothetical protein
MDFSPITSPHTCAMAGQNQLYKADDDNISGFMSCLRRKQLEAEFLKVGRFDNADNSKVKQHYYQNRSFPSSQVPFI